MVKVFHGLRSWGLSSGIKEIVGRHTRPNYCLSRILPHKKRLPAKQAKNAMNPKTAKHRAIPTS